MEKLIEKYFNGETSLEEEAQLHDFFQGEEIPDHLKTYQAQFKMLNELNNSQPSLSDDDLFSKLEKSEAKVVTMKPSYQTWFYRVAAAAAIVLVSVWAGTQLVNSDVNEMKQEVAMMKSLMLEQLESTSASGRLQAVSNSTALPNSDDETVDVLIAVMKNDESVHVRSKAIEALLSFDNSQKIAKAFNGALLNETEPTVQIALIEGVKLLKQKSSIAVLENIVNQEEVLKEVKDEAHLSLFQLKEL